MSYTRPPSSTSDQNTRFAIVLVVCITVLLALIIIGAFDIKLTSSHYPPELEEFYRRMAATPGVR